MRDPLHLAASLGTAATTVALIGLAVFVDWAPAALAGEGPNLDEMEAIEASIAYKKAEPPKQPQKQKRAPVPEEIEGVSRDENKTPVEPKKDDKRKPDENFEDQYKKFQRKDDEDLEAGKPTDEDVGSFDGSEFGFAEETKGDPYFQKLVLDLREGWEYPEILSDVGVPVACIRLAADGKILDTNFRERSNNAELDDSVERALAALKKKRGQEPVPVPTHLLKWTTKWTCFRLKPSAAR